MRQQQQRRKSTNTWLNEEVVWSVGWPVRWLVGVLGYFIVFQLCVLGWLIIMSPLELIIKSVFAAALLLRQPEVTVALNSTSDLQLGLGIILFRNVGVYVVLVPLAHCLLHGWSCRLWELE